jgi:tetratricopeptide (TPR) repeat protein
VALGLLVAWTALQPLRAQQRGDAALAAAEKGDFAAARAAARQAHDRNPLSPDPYFDLATVEDAAGRTAAARVALERAVRLVPSSPETWRRLGAYELDVLDRPRTALRALSAAVALAPNDPTVQGDFLRAAGSQPADGDGRERLITRRAGPREREHAARPGGRGSVATRDGHAPRGGGGFRPGGRLVELGEGHRDAADGAAFPRRPTELVNRG